ncbi:MAG: CPBP family intramembrane glutamic endopeptidase [Actinomycetota bacterium]
MAAFLIMVYGVNVAVALPPALTRRDLLPFGQAPYDWLGHILGSALPAFLVMAAVHGRAGVRDLARRSLRWRVGVRWYVLALLGMPVATVLVASALLGAAPLNALLEEWASLFTVILPQLLLLIVFSNLYEEIGWTGFLFARLQHRYGPLKASVVVTVPFALFDLPGFIVESGSVTLALALLGLFVIPHLCSRVIVAWLYNNTNHSVLLVGLFHSAFNATTQEFARRFIPAPVEVQFLILNGILIGAAVLIAVLTRGRLSYTRAVGPNRMSTTRQETPACGREQDAFREGGQTLTVRSER